MRRCLPLLAIAMLALGCAHTRPQTGPPAVASVWVDPTAQSPAEQGTREAPYHALSTAMRRVAPGTEIHLAEGTYRINFRVNASLALSGEGARRMPLLVAADASLPVIDLAPGASATLRAVAISGGECGLKLGSGATAKISGCRIAQNREAGIAMEPSMGWLSRAPLVTVEGSRIEDNGVGVRVDEAAIQLHKCRIENNHSAGVLLSGDAALGVVASRVNRNDGPGIDLETGHGANVTIDQNDIRQNGGEGVVVRPEPGGWLSPDRSWVLIKSNTIMGNHAEGVALRDRATGAALDPDAGYDRVRLEDNDFAGNGGDGATAGITAQ